MPRTARNCTICGAKVVKLSNHLSQVHKLPKEERAQMLLAARASKPDPRTTGKPKQKRMKRMCPIDGCSTATDRLHDHLTGKHGLSGETWKKARLELLKVAKMIKEETDSDESSSDDDEIGGMVPFKAERKVETIDLDYLRPDCYQEKEETMLPLPTWAHTKELQRQLIEQEKVDPQNIFGNAEYITVNLTDIFSRKRKRKRR